MVLQGLWATLLWSISSSAILLWVGFNFLEMPSSVVHQWRPSQCGSRILLDLVCSCYELCEYWLCLVCSFFWWVFHPAFELPLTNRIVSNNQFRPDITAETFMVCTMHRFCSIKITGAVLWFVLQFRVNQIRNVIAILDTWKDPVSRLQSNTYFSEKLCCIRRTWGENGAFPSFFLSLSFSSTSPTHSLSPALVVVICDLWNTRPQDVFSCSDCLIVSLFLSSLFYRPPDVWDWASALQPLITLHLLTLTITCTCCYDESKGTHHCRNPKLSHCHSLILSHLYFSHLSFSQHCFALCLLWWDQWNPRPQELSSCWFSDSLPSFSDA